MSPNQIEVFGWEVKIPSTKDVFPESLLTANEDENVQPDALEEVEEDSLTVDLTEIKKSSTWQPVEEKPLVVKTPKGAVAIEYPNNEKTYLDSFFQGLSSISEEGNLIRVLHYGDSQLEGDRMTERLRKNLQQQFGGCGVGLVPIMELKNMRTTLSQDYSNNWDQYLCFGPKKYRGKHNDYGFFGKYFTYEGTEASINFTKAPYSKKLHKEFENFNVYLRNTVADVGLDYAMNSVEGKTVNIEASSTPKMIKLPISGALGEVDVHFKSDVSPEVYGVSFDCNSGIAVDNIPMRGSSGTDFTKIRKGLLGDLVKDLNVKLVILQFGVNVVPQEAENYSFYERLLVKQINYFKEVNPDIKLLIVGVSDMARKNGQKIESYPNIDAVRAAERRAANKAGAAYWDLYLAMGGPNSIVKWADKSPAWAGRDYTHFTRKGANFIGDMLHNELMREYQRYKNRNKEDVTSK
ncbi:hypothetical protein KMW28_01645 [Flammeovirga yaeyamensis]|uniref:SGNH hydrolase-type esterase domain-containing protein n=1 Tax=Flammeovirga yaeyamensis TaxID=367791 RepID=A0AAX1N4F2_9BACT|nr:GDSL-type esterase/lipase family protein [Flammeovirga yaeyamensis]MBB3699790.1 lysophospholipase L1-like esterase [Flammeovirga yaeyamensis]NMF36641.1 hypothetical protein [Flammeovirga yaeyamensis]QWG02314.1 hypothetical protein KMW28_01645 [Flammeovirga yaeyamensis]